MREVKVKDVTDGQKGRNSGNEMTKGIALLDGISW